MSVSVKCVLVLRNMSVTIGLGDFHIVFKFHAYSVNKMLSLEYIFTPKLFI